MNRPNLPQKALPRRRGTMISLALLLTISSAMRFEYVRRQEILSAGFADAPDGVFVILLDSMIAALVLVLIVMGVRRYERRRRHMTPAEYQHYYVARSDKPDYLFWPRESIPKRAVTASEDWLSVGFYQRTPRLASSTAAIVVVSLLTVVSVSFGSIPAYAEEGVVVKVIDGDTLDVRIGTTTERVRLLNVNAPEFNRVSGESECLGPEATDAARELLREGEVVTLEYDNVRRDRYGRLLAGVTNADGLSVNVELVRRGLATAAMYDGNVRFYAAATQAMRQADSRQLGVFDPSTECSPAATLVALEAAVMASETPLPAESAAIALIAAESVALLDELEMARRQIGAAAWLSTDARTLFLTRLAGWSDRAQEWSSNAAAAEAIALAREKANAEVLAAAEAQRADAEAARIAAEAEAVARAAAEQAAAEEASRAPTGSGTEISDAGDDSSSSGGAGGYPSDAGYTGCRNYNGVGMIDDQGRSFQPIPC